jgi:ferredoxin
MYGTSSEEKDNSSFLRGSEQGSLYRFCFNCHQEENFQKANPHQLGVSSEGRPPCFRCHTENLYSGFETSFQASVKTKDPSLCIGCHWNLGEEHIGHVLLEANKLSENEAALKALEQEGIDLPLPEGRIHCTTCHNPHPPGIIGRKEAATGAGEKHFLRITGSEPLCRTCHPDGSVDQNIQLFRGKQH